MSDTTKGGVTGTASQQGTPSIFAAPLPSGFNHDTDNAGTVQDFLTSKGVEVGWVAISKDAVEVEAASDPRSTLATYQPVASQAQQIKDQLASIDLDNADLATVRQAIGLLVQLVSQPEAVQP